MRLQELKKAIVKLHAFSSIASSSQGAPYLPDNIVPHIGYFLTGDGNDHEKVLNEINRRARVRGLRAHSLFQPVVTATTEAVETQAAPTVWKK